MGTNQIQDATTIILLPLFFAFTGLRTQIGLLDDAQSWLICTLVLAVAILGKLGGATIAARLPATAGARPGSSVRSS